MREPLYIILAIYIIAWLLNAIDSLLFRSFIRKNYPSVAENYYPDFLKQSPHQQITTLSWVWKGHYKRIASDQLSKSQQL